MGRNNNMQRPTLETRHTSRLPVLINILSESYTLPISEISSPDAPATPPTNQPTPTHETSASNIPVPPKEETSASNEANDMITSPEQIPTDIRVSSVFIEGSELAKKVRAVIDEAHRRLSKADYYGKSKVAARITKPSELVQLPPFATEFFAKNIDLQRSRTETKANLREQVKPGPEGYNGCGANFGRIKHSFVPIYTGSSFINERTKGAEKSWNGEKKAYFGPADDISYFLTQAHEPCVDQRTRPITKDLSADLPRTDCSSPCSSSGGSQGSDDTTLTCPSDEGSPLGGDMKTPKLRENAAPPALDGVTEALIASLGVTGSPKPADYRPLPSYQPLPGYSSPTSDGQRTPKCFADCVQTLSESSQEEVRGRTMFWNSSSTIRVTSREKHSNYIYRHRSPNRIYSPIDKRTPSPDWTELKRQKTRALNIRLNGSQVLHKLKGKQSQSTSNTHTPSKLRKVPAIRSFAILDTPDASGFTANGMRHDLEDIEEEGESVNGTQACGSPIDVNKDLVSEPYNQTDSDESGVLFMKAYTRGWSLKVQTHVNSPEQELKYHPLPDMEVRPTSRHWGSQESLATTIADTEETDLILTKVPARKGKHWAQEICDGYEYHLLRHANAASVRESWNTNGVFVIGTDEENQAPLTRDRSPTSPRINPIDYQSIYSDQGGSRLGQIRKLCRTDSIPDLDLDSLISQDTVPMTPPASPCRSFEEHQEIKHGLVSGSYPKIPAQIPDGHCHDSFSSSEFRSAGGIAKASSSQNENSWIGDKTFSDNGSIPCNLRVNLARIATDDSEASNPQREARRERRGNDSGYSTRSATPQHSDRMPRAMTTGTSDDDTNITRGRTTTLGRTQPPVANNTRPTRSQPRRGTGRVTFAPLPDTGRRRARSEGHIYHTQWSRAQERSPSPSHRFPHKTHKYDKDEKPKIELPPVRKQPLKADSPPPEDLNAPARVISSQPYPFVHQRAERPQHSGNPMDLNNFVLPGLQGQPPRPISNQPHPFVHQREEPAQRSSDPLDLNNFVLPGAQRNGKGERKGGKGGQRSMRAMVQWPSDLLQFFLQGSAFGKRYSIREGVTGEEDPAIREKSTRNWHQPLTIRPASVDGAGELLEVDASISCTGEESTEKEDKANDSPPLRTSSSIFDSRKLDRGERDKDNDSPSSPSSGGGGETNGTWKIPWGTTYSIDKDEVPFYSSTTPELEGAFNWQEKRKLPEYRRLRVGSKTYVFDECHEIIDIRFSRKEKIRRHEPFVCGEDVNFSHITTTSMKEVSPSSVRARSLKAHLDRTRDSRLGRGSGSTDFDTSSSHEYRRCYRCGKVLFFSCVCACDGQSHREDSDQRTCVMKGVSPSTRAKTDSMGSVTSPSKEYRNCSRCGKVVMLSCICGFFGDLNREDSDRRLYSSFFTERNKGFHTLIPLPDTHSPDGQRDHPADFEECDTAEKREVDDFIEENLVTFPTFTGSPGSSQINQERLGLIAPIGSFNAVEYERQEKRDPQFSEESEASKMIMADLDPTACIDSGDNQDTPKFPTMEEIVEVEDWLQVLSALENGLSPWTPSTPQANDTQKRDVLDDAIAQTVQHINDLVHIRKTASFVDDEEKPRGQRWQDRWRETFLVSLAHLHRLLEQDDDRRINARIDRQLMEQELEMAEVDRRLGEMEREIREQMRRRWYEWFDVDLEGDVEREVEWVQCMVGHLVAARISDGMRREREWYGC